MRTRRTGKEGLHTRVVQDKRRKNDRSRGHDRCTSCGSNGCEGWCCDEDLNYEYALTQGLLKLPGVLCLTEVSGSELIVYVKEHGDVDRTKLLAFEDAWDVEIKVRATQGRDPKNFP